MAEVVVARLSLFVNSEDPAVLDEFDKRFPRAVENQWRRIVFPKDDFLGRNLDSAMEQGVLSLVQEFDTSEAEGMNAYGNAIGSPIVWKPGSNGQHEKDSVVGLVDGAGSNTPWTFDVTTGDPVDTVTVEVRSRVMWTVVDLPD